MQAALIVLSDLDGTLVDSGPAVDRAWAAWGELHDVPLIRIRAVAPGRPSAEVIAELAPRLDSTAEAAFLDGLQAEDTGDVAALPGALTLLDGSTRRGVAIVTSAPRRLALARLTAAGLPLPAVTVTGDQLHRGKPDPQGYLLAAELMGARPSDCVVLEDAPAGVAAGRAAGMHVVGVLTTSTAEELHGAHELHPDVASWLASPGATARS